MRTLAFAIQDISFQILLLSSNVPSAILLASNVRKVLHKIALLVLIMLLILVFHQTWDAYVIKDSTLLLLHLF